MKFLDILLKEGRKEDLKKKYSDKYDQEDLDFILSISDLQDFNHKYTDWVLKHLLEYADVIEVAEIAVRLVKDFDKYQKNLEKKDINQYLSIEELEKVLESFKGKEKEKELESQTEKIYEDENFLVLVPKTIEASCKYGAGTKWCTTVRDADHFQRYTRGKQGLYYIIRKKGKQTEPHYKVAVHFNDIGSEKWWDAKDRPMTDSSIELFKEYFPQLWEAISKHYEENKKISLKDLDRIFEVKDQSLGIYKNFHNVVNQDLKLLITGYDVIPNMEGKAIGNLKIYLNDEILDEYDVFVNYSSRDNNKWSASVGFSEDFDEEPKYDFKLWEGWGFDLTINLTSESRMVFDRFVLDRVSKKIREDQNFEKYVKGITGPVWKPRVNYGYTFGKNKGLIKKLVNYLDSGYDNGTKLDFLEYIGKLKTRVVNGKKEYAHSHSDVYHPSKQFRGHFASFFASAKHAGIIDYVKEGSKFLIKPGPNFEAFKKGELKAL
jgi:hypothetical protein